MGSCCGIASESGIASHNELASSTAPPPQPTRGRWPGFMGAVHHEEVTPKRSGGLSFTSSFLAKKLSFTRRGGTDTASLYSSAVVAAPSTAPLAASHSADTLAASAHARDVSVKATPQHGTSGKVRDLLLPDLYYISASSSSSLLANDDNAEGVISARRDGEEQSSLVEVSQPTQSFAGDAHTYSELDVTSEWEPSSFDRTGRRPERRGRSGSDRGRLRQLLIREAEVRASLTTMYTYQHQRCLTNVAKEHLIAVHSSMWQLNLRKFTVLHMCWITAMENVTRKELAHACWAERAALVRRVASFKIPPPPPPSARKDTMRDIAASDAVKREDSLPHASNSYMTADLTSSEEAVEGDTLNVCSPPARASSSMTLLSSPQHQLSVFGRSRAASAGVFRTFHSTP
ncbi:hypothetical protein, conserved [Leishmania tarentolae]|uniref:Uncharacterized protein n=1 Tax=Leishmania tarentolae TaxID=5689 RepID=A0A640K891_LEITA|nr:hypothetical protein, conserved [Leishmania tarentolae]